MATSYRVADHSGKNGTRTGVFLKFKIIAVIVVLVVLVALVLVAAFLGPSRKRSNPEASDNSSGQRSSIDEQTTQLSCDVAIVGGGISGLYVAETLLRLQKEANVCLFERDDRYGGRIRDHSFQRAPDIPVSLGAWRVDESHSTVWEIFKRFNMSLSYAAKNNQDRLEARGFFATDILALKQKAFPALSHVRFQNATYQQMLAYLNSHLKEAANFTSLSDFEAEHLTPEGFQLFSHMNAFNPNNDYQPNPESLTDSSHNGASFKHNYSRPVNGLSAVTRALKTSAVKLGAKLYKDENVRVIQENEKNQFELITTRYRVTANKLVLAVPVNPMKQIKGSIAERIQNDPIFYSIGFMEAFKGFAVFEGAWWQSNTTGSRYLADEQEMLSSSDCLGFTVPYKARGPKGVAVLQISYAKMYCAVKWGELFKMKSKEDMDQEILKALRRLFPGVDIPKPLESIYVYWEEGYRHIQRAGTHLSAFKVVDWAKRPFPGRDLFMVGEAYHPLRGWIEGALLSAQNALREGWNK